MLSRTILATALFLVLQTFAATAHETMVGDLMIGHPWARATVGQSKYAAAYFTLMNTGNMADRLIAASTPIAEKAELHTHFLENGVMRMRPVDGIDVQPGAPVELKPGGLHIMLMGMKDPLKEGSTFPLTLTFQKSGVISVTVQVESPSQMGDGHDGHHMH
jgi:hypothetical protein